MIVEGSIHTLGRCTRFACKTWNEALGQLAPRPSGISDGILFDSANHMTAENGNVVGLESDVILRSGEQLILGRVVTITISSDLQHSYIIYYPFIWQPTLDSEFFMPAVDRLDYCETAPCTVCDQIICLQLSSYK
jgi:hypothetical protein